MTDIFFSYSSKDRERVRPIRDALAAQGFDIFWDQQVPAGVDWDTWIRQHLQRAKCAVVFWSGNSVASDNVRHEATVAKTQGKLVPVLIEDLRPDQFPMGLYSTQGANLVAWAPGPASSEWQKLQAEVEAKLTPLWVTAKIHNADAAVLAERARREAAESRIRALQEQLAKEAQARHAAELARDVALAEVEGLKAKRVDAEAAREEAVLRIQRLALDLKSRGDDLAAIQQKYDRIAAGQGVSSASAAVPGLLEGGLDVFSRWAGWLGLLLVPVAATGWIIAPSVGRGPNATGDLLLVLGLTAAHLAAALLLLRAHRFRWSFVKVGLLLVLLFVGGLNVASGVKLGFIDLLSRGL
jgi:hypothetical protein